MSWAKVRKMRLMFLLDKLNCGGAERQLIELVKGMASRGHDTSVVVFHDQGDLQRELGEADGVEVMVLPRDGGICRMLSFPAKLGKAIRRRRPHLLHGYMGGTNELCLVMGRLTSTPVVWGIRASNMDLPRYGRFARWRFAMGAFLSRHPSLIIVNSRAGAAHHAGHGYSPDRMMVIPNGIDTERYYPDETAGTRLRREWSIGAEEIAIGISARLDPMKDHETFLKAAALLCRSREDIRFICIGDYSGAHGKAMRSLGERLGLGNRLMWTGRRDDMMCAYNALDILTCCSAYGEGFSNAVGEAMACGKLCVVTDVGDAASIVGETGVVVASAGSPEDLVSAWMRVLSMPAAERKSLGEAARRRILDLFSREMLITRTEEALSRVIERAPHLEAFHV